MAAVKTMTGAFAAWGLVHCGRLISDLRLPAGDGWELLHPLPLPRPIKAVAVSGLGLAADRARSLATRCWNQPVEPFVVQELVAAARPAVRV